MKKKLSLAASALACIFQSANAQSSPQTVIGSAGTFTSFTGGSIAWTIGEVITETYSPSGYFFTQGFHQPDTAYLTLVPDLSSQNISIYPNPVVNNLMIDLSLTNGFYKIELFDMQGKLVRKEGTLMHQKQLVIPFYELANGIYLLNIINAETNTRNSYRINKSE